MVKSTTLALSLITSPNASFSVTAIAPSASPAVMMPVGCVVNSSDVRRPRRDGKRLQRRCGGARNSAHRPPDLR